GAAVSSERDYLSRALSLDVRLSSADRNRTYAFGVGGASDRIDSTNGVAKDKQRQTIELLFGVTQALSAESIVQSNITYSTGHGYYSDPPFGQGFDFGKSYTADTRLSAFGAITPGIAVAKLLPEGWSIDLKVELYRQRSGWRIGGGGSPGLEPFSARWIEAGIAKTF